MREFRQLRETVLALHPELRTTITERVHTEGHPEDYALSTVYRNRVRRIYSQIGEHSDVGLLPGVDT